MKIAVTGKGGVGKTTISAVLARLYAEEGKKVFAVDVDSDANLGLALGFSEEELESITPISKMRRLIEERTGADKSNTFYKVNPKVDDIPEIYGKENNGVRLLVLGTGPMSRFSTSKNEKFLPILTCQKLSLSVRSFIHSFEFVCRHIVAMTMNSFRIVESFQIFKNQLVCLLIVANFKAIEPFTSDTCQCSWKIWL